MDTFGKLAPACPGDIELPSPDIELDIPIVIADWPEYMETPGIPKFGDSPDMPVIPAL